MLLTLLILFSVSEVVRADNLPVKPSVISISYPEAVKVGLEKNLDLVAQKLSISLGEASELLAETLANPTLQLDTQLMSFSLPFAPSWSQSNTGGPSQQDIYLNIPIDLTMKRAKAGRAARSGTQMIEAQFQNQVMLKKVEIQNSYVSLALLQSLVSLYQDRQEVYDQLQKLISNRTGSSQLLPQLLERARMAAAQMRFELENKKSDLAQESIRLSALLGSQESSENIRASTPLQGFKKHLDPVDLPKMVDLAYQSRLDLKALAFQQVQAVQEGEAARARVLDDVTVIAGASYQNKLGANLNLSGPNANNPEVPGAWSWIAGVVVPIPVFSQNKGGIMRAHFLQDQADAQKRALEMQIRSEIEIAIKSVHLTSKHLSEFEKSALVSARKVRDGVQRLFGTGNVSLLEYLDSMNAYYGMVTSYFQTLSDHQRSIIRLNQTISTDVL